jgi:hypothetical protein
MAWRELGKEVGLMAELECDFCGEAIEDDPIHRGSKVYCCEACAFEATRSTDCAGSTSSVMNKPKSESMEA